MASLQPTDSVQLNVDSCNQGLACYNPVKHICVQVGLGGNVVCVQVGLGGNVVCVQVDLGGNVVTGMIHIN